MKDDTTKKFSYEIKKFQDAVENMKNELIKTLSSSISKVVIVAESPMKIVIGVPKSVRITPSSPNVFIYGKEIIITENQVILTPGSNVAVFVTPKNKLMSTGDNSVTTRFVIEPREALLNELLPYYIQEENRYVKSDLKDGKLYFTMPEKIKENSSKYYDIKKLTEDIKTFIE